MVMTWNLKNLNYVLGSVCYILLGKPLSFRIIFVFSPFPLDHTILPTYCLKLIYFLLSNGGIH